MVNISDDLRLIREIATGYTKYRGRAVQTVIDHLHEPIHVRFTDGTPGYFNECYLDLFRVTRKLAQSRSLSDVFIDEDKHSGMARKWLGQAELVKRSGAGIMHTRAKAGAVGVVGVRVDLLSFSGLVAQRFEPIPVESASIGRLVLRPFFHPSHGKYCKDHTPA